MSIRKLAVLAALIPTAALAVTATPLVATNTVAAAMPVCRDSNGRFPGGSVYARYGRTLGCDVVPPQRLHVTRVPSAEMCDDMGGHGWTRRVPTCWRVDY